MRDHWPLSLPMLACDLLRHLCLIIHWPFLDRQNAEREQWWVAWRRTTTRVLYTTDWTRGRRLHLHS